MKQKIKDFFLTLRYYISFPYYWLSTRKVDKKLTQVAAEDRAALLTEKDVEFLRSIGVETELNTLQNERKTVKH
ncbi:MAG: hypothetical protein J1G05_06265 [Clostridiales bacterium]|nr:hypothetical protein [Clostridiales bacterium]